MYNLCDIKFPHLNFTCPQVNHLAMFQEQCSTKINSPSYSLENQLCQTKSNTHQMKRMNNFGNHYHAKTSHSH